MIDSRRPHREGRGLLVLFGAGFVVAAGCGQTILSPSFPRAGDVSWADLQGRIAVSVEPRLQIGLSLLDADTREVRVVAGGAPLSGFTLSPDGERVLFGRHSLQSDGTVMSELRELSTSGPPAWCGEADPCGTVLRAEPGADLAYPALSGDGRLVYVRSAEGVSRYYVDGTPAHDEGAATYSGGYSNPYSRAAWTPEGELIARLTFGSPVDRRVALYRIDPDTRTTEELIWEPGWTPTDPVVSPDGTRIAYTLTEDRTRFSYVWVADIDGSDRRSLVLGSEPQWSRDGASIMYVATYAQGWALYTIGSDDFGRPGTRVLLDVQHFSWR